jgi:two-component system, chemotaxis family, sensor kinase CheA
VDQTRRQFLAETEDLVEHIFVDLDEAREKQGDRLLQREVVDNLFRNVHRIKGSAASFGLDGLNEIAHEFETLLSAIRDRRTVLDDVVIDVCEEAASTLAESLNLAASGVVEPSRRALFERIKTLAQGNSHSPAADIDSILSKLPFEIWQSLTDEEKQRLVQAVEEGVHLCVVRTSFDIATFDEEFYRLKEKLAQRGAVISTTPTVDAEHSDKINFRVLFASSAGVPAIAAELIDFSGVDVTEVASSGDTASGGPEATPLAADLRPASVSSLSNFVRTDLDDLDGIISSTHELFRLTSKALTLALSQTGFGQELREHLEDLDAKIRRAFIKVEDELIGLRMVSVGPILQQANRAGKAAARASNKEINFQVAGSDLRVDKLLRDAIADPLVHLVRNAVDHGIETFDERRQWDKKDRGLVRIAAFSEGGQTCVRVQDDGRGVDPARVSEAAIARGIIRSDDTLDMDRSLRLIFRPGFSTVASASALSGRGVGLDVVENAVETVGGELRVSSERGKGSIFEIRFPVSFGVLHALAVGCADTYYCLDSSSVVTNETIDAAQVETAAEGREFLRSENEMLPVMRLRELLGLSAEESGVENLEVIVCELPGSVGERLNGKKRVGIIVDSIAGTEEVLVRSLGRHAARWQGVAGATELRNGEVALVLDLPRLLSTR